MILQLHHGCPLDEGVHVVAGSVVVAEAEVVSVMETAPHNLVHRLAGALDPACRS